MKAKGRCQVGWPIANRASPNLICPQEAFGSADATTSTNFCQPLSTSFSQCQPTPVNVSHLQSPSITFNRLHPPLTVIQFRQPRPSPTLVYASLDPKCLCRMQFALCLRFRPPYHRVSMSLAPYTPYRLADLAPILGDTAEILVVINLWQSWNRGREGHPLRCKASILSQSPAAPDVALLPSR